MSLYFDKQDTRAHIFIMLIITPSTHDLGAFEVRRTLPSKARTMVGPFIFVDQFGPAHFDIGSGMDVRPHPHINLATVTYLFQGAIDHRDSLGTYAMGALSDAMRTQFGDDSLRYSILAGSGCYIFAAIFFFLAARRLKEDWEE